MSQPDTLTSYLASRVTSSNAHQAILVNGQRKELIELAKNPQISKEIWWALAKQRQNAEIAFNLVHTPHILDEAQTRFILKDRRKTLQGSIFANCLGNISPELAHELLTKLQNNESLQSADLLAIMWLRGKTPPPDDLVKPLLALTNQRVALEIPLKWPALFTTSEILELLTESKHLFSSTTLIWELIDRRPELTKELVATTDSCLLEAVTGSRHLFQRSDFQTLLATLSQMDYTHPESGATQLNVDALVNLLANPNCPIDIRVAVKDELVQINKLQGNTLSIYHIRHVDGKPNHLTANGAVIRGFTAQPPATLIQTTGDWQQLDEQSWQQLLTKDPAQHLLIPERYPTLKRLRPQAPIDPITKRSLKVVGPTLAQINAARKSGFINISTKQLLQEIEKPLDAIGKDGWATLIALAASWDEDIAGLLDTALAVSKAG